MKTIYILLVLVIALCSNTFSQQYLGAHDIVHKKGKKRSKERFKWKKETLKEASLYRNLEFDLKFDENCQYKLPSPWEYEQNYKKKVVTLCTSQGNDGRNSLRVGWYWDIDSLKFGVAFYAHINHHDDGPIGREQILLKKNVNTGEWIHVKMAIGKKGMFMSIDDQSAIVSRDIFSWSENGEETYVRAFSYFDYGVKPIGGGSYPAVQDMDFHIKNAYVDNPDFSWEKVHMMKQVVMIDKIGGNHKKTYSIGD